MLRRATLEDASSVHRVHMESIRGLAGAHYSPAQIEAWCGNRSPLNYLRPIQDQVMFVAEHEAQVVGFSQLSLDEAKIVAVYVQPGFGRKGVGTALLRALESAAVSAGITEVTLQASLNAVPFYARAGYVVGELTHHTVASGVRLPCVAMSRALE